MPVPADCPPIEAAPSEGVFYRLVPGTLGVGEQTTSDCWQAPHRARKGQCAGRTEICACHAFSVFGEISDARTVRKFVPAFSKKAIAQVQVDATMGAFQRTPTSTGTSEREDSHHDWWPDPPELVPASLVVEGRP